MSVYVELSIIGIELLVAASIVVKIWNIGE